MTWAEAVQNILTSPDSWITLIFLLVFFIVSVILVKTGFLSVNTGKIRLSSRDKEQRVMREQITYAHSVCMGTMQQILRDDTMKTVDPIHVERVVEKVYDEVIQWIAFNHLTADELYLKNKVKKIQLIIDTYIPPDKKHDIFDELIETTVREMVKELVEIREWYSKK